MYMLCTCTYTGTCTLVRTLHGRKVNLLQLCIWMECRHGHAYVGVVGIALSGDEHNLGNVRVLHTADTFVSLNFDT